jgi:hypothetical protein
LKRSQIIRRKIHTGLFGVSRRLREFEFYIAARSGGCDVRALYLGEQIIEHSALGVGT